MFAWFTLAVWLMMQSGRAQDEGFDPIPQVDAGGHTSRVMSICFNSSGDTLWSAGWDKTVRQWKRSADGRWLAQPDQTIYAPLGPGRNGVIDTLAISPDDRYLAFGGYSRIIKASRFREQGVERPLSAEQLLDQGAIYVYDRVTQSLKRMLGHRGPVRRLTFDARSATPRLTSAGFEVALGASGMRTGGGLRIWDVDNMRQVAALDNLPAPVDPGLLFLPSSSGSRILANWGQGKTYLWDTQKAVATTAGQGSQLLAHSLNGSWLVTGGVGAQAAGQLTFWDASQPGALRPLPAATTLFPGEGGTAGQLNFLPLVAVAFKAKTSQQEYLAVATLSWKPGPNNGPSQAIGYQLRTFEVAAPSAASREVSRVDLWPAGRNSALGMPSLASSQGGNALAVANGTDGQIALFGLDELTVGQANREILHNRLLQVQSAGFVTRGSDSDRRVGLLVQTPADQSLVLDISGNELSRSGVEGWQSFGSSANGWAIEGNNPGGYSIIGGNGRPRLQLPPEVSYVTSLFVPSPAGRPPWLVVAGEEQGQPWLGVFDATTGELVRLLTVHTNRILTLAGSRDGRFVLSTSADQTVALWDFSSTDQLLSRHSALAGIALLDSAAGIVVNNASPTTGLIAGDKLLALVDGQNATPVSTEQQVHDTVWNRLPGSSITLRMQRGAGRHDVALVLSPAVDERKPLCQAMFIQTANGPEWIVWSPIGYYDVSSLDICSYLGWLFNPTSENQSVRFVGSDRYPKLYTPRLLDELWTQPQQDLSKVSLRRMNPALDLVINRPVSDRRDADGRLVLRAPPEIVALALTNEFPIDMLEAPELFLDGQLIGKMSPSGFSAWRAPPGAFSGVAAGAHQLLARTAVKGLSRSFEVELAFQFTPPPPSIVLANEIPSHTKEASVSLLATIRSVSPKLPVQALVERLDRNDKTTEVARPKTAEKITLETPLELAVGVNRFRLSARHAIEQPVHDQAVSTAELLLTIERHPLDSSPPEFLELAVSAPDPESPAPLPEDARKTSYRVPYDKVHLRGRIVAKELITEAKLGPDTFQAFEPKKRNTFEFFATVPLKPGTNRIELSSATVGGGSTNDQLLVEYQPPLPKLRVDFPPAGYEITQLQSPPQIQLLLATEPEPFVQDATLEVLVNGNSISKHAVSSEAASSIESPLPLRVGKNVCQLRVVGTADGRVVTLPLTYNYLPAPQINSVSVPETTRQPLFNFMVSGLAATEIERVLLDGQEVSAEQWRASFDGSNFHVDVSAPIVDNESRSRLLTIYSREVPNPAITPFIQPTNLGPIQPPVLTWLSPVEAAAVTASAAMVKFEVRSSEPLTRLTLNDLDVAVDQRSSRTPGVFVVERNVDLRPGANTLRITAENPGGSAARELVVQRLLPPGYVETVSLQMADRSFVQPAASGDAEWRFDRPLPAGRDLTLHFTVLGDEAGEVWVTVNGFRRRAVAAGARSRPGHADYRCPIILTQQVDNMIEVLPALPTARASRTRIRLDCAAPVQPRQRLHLALIGIGVTDEQEFIEGAVRSLSGQSLKRVDARLYEFQATAFERCFAYGPYAGDEVSRGVINFVLTNDIPNNISQQASDPLVSDVVLFYYRGGEQVSHAGEFYLTTQTQNPALDAIMRSPRWLQNRAISSTYLSGVMNELQGAHVMMLDVARRSGEPAGAVPVISSFAPHAATYRFAWIRPNTVPNDARLMTALNDAFQRSDNLAKIEQELGREHAELSTRYADAIRYEHNIPITLRSLIMHE